MTKEITKARIIQEIQDKFKLREFDPAPFLFDETVVPTYDVSKHLTEVETLFLTKSITAGPDGYVFFTAPVTERWELYAYNVIFMTGSYTVAGLMTYDTSVTEYLYLDLTAAQSVSYSKVLPMPITINPGGNLALYVDGYTTTGNLQLRIMVRKDEIR